MLEKEKILREIRSDEKKIMKAVILAGGFGTRMNEETKSKPKPMIRIGTQPILWHIMKIYAHYNIKEFIICGGYKNHIIKEYFEKLKESWDVILVDTGIKTMTGGRIKKIKKYVEDETFCLTYGDTLNNVNIKQVIDFHFHSKRLATVTASIPPEKYGVLKLRQNKVIEFKEKISRKGEWVNGGYFVLEPDIFNYITESSMSWENEPMHKLVKDGQLSAFKHYGFYQPMDTTYEMNILEKMWNSNNAPWKIWK